MFVAVAGRVANVLLSSRPASVNDTAPRCGYRMG